MATRKVTKKTEAKHEIHSKVVSIIVSIGTQDRERSHEDFVEDIRKRLGIVEYGKKGLHGTVTGGYYILDGKVCLPEDYDISKGTFKEGASPPPWAGGDSKDPSTGHGATAAQMKQDAENLSPDAYDRKYKIGKYAPTPRKYVEQSRLITPEMQKARRDADRAKREEEQIEEFDWDIEDVEDDKKLGKIADKSASRAVKILKSKKPKRKVVKRVKAK